MHTHPQDYYKSGTFQRDAFFRDFSASVNASGKSAASILRAFFYRDTTLSLKTKAEFARGVSPNLNLVHGAVVLLHTLRLSAQEASAANIMVEAFGLSASDPFAWAQSWTVDDMMNWPRDTTMLGSVKKAAGVAKVLG